MDLQAVAFQSPDGDGVPAAGQGSGAFHVSYGLPMIRAEADKSRQSDRSNFRGDHYSSCDPATKRGYGISGNCTNELLAIS